MLLTLERLREVIVEEERERDKRKGTERFERYRRYDSLQRTVNDRDEGEYTW